MTAPNDFQPMMPVWISILLAAAGALGGGAGIAALLKMRSECRALESEIRRNDAESVRSIAGAWESLLHPLRERVRVLEEEVARQEKEINQLWHWIEELFQGAQSLYDQVLDLGAEPRYIPRRPVLGKDVRGPPGLGDQ